MPTMGLASGPVMSRVRWWAVVVCLVATGCSGGGHSSSQGGASATTGPSQSRSLNGDRFVVRTVLRGTQISNVVWVTSNSLVGTVLVVDKNRSDLHTVDTASGVDRRVSLANTAVAIPERGSPKRSGWEYRSDPEMLPDGRIGVVRDFFDAKTLAYSRPEYASVRLESPTSGTVQSLFPIPPLAGGVPLDTVWTWNHDLTDGYVTVRTGLSVGCTTIARFRHRTWEPLDLHVGTAATGWTLGDSQRDAIGDECNPKAGSARVSPVTARGQPMVIFFATPGAVPRPDAPFPDYVENIYATQFGSPTAKILLGDVVAGDVELSPDGQLLAWNGKRRGGKWGCWILDLRTNQVRRISDALFDHAAWSPDGGSLAELDSVDGTVTIFDRTRGAG